MAHRGFGGNVPPGLAQTLPPSAQETHPTSPTPLSEIYTQNISGDGESSKVFEELGRYLKVIKGFLTDRGVINEVAVLVCFRRQGRVKTISFLSATVLLFYLCVYTYTVLSFVFLILGFSHLYCISLPTGILLNKAALYEMTWSRQKSILIATC